MSKIEKLVAKIIFSKSDNNFNFEELISLLLHLGFESRINGSHHIMTRNDVKEIINLQPKHGKAKPYQVKQVRELIIKYKLFEVDE